MCSSTLFVNCEQVAKDTVEKILCRTQFRSGHMLAICAGLSSKGKVGVQRGRKTAGCPSFLPTAVGTASSPPRGAARSRRPQTANPLAEVQRKAPRPSGANTPAAVRVPRSAGAEKDCRPDRANTLTQFEYPAQPVQRKRLPPVRANPPTRVRVPCSPCADKRTQKKAPERVPFR